MIGGNVNVTIQICTASKNSIGEAAKNWTNVQTLHGFIDLTSGDARYSNFNAKIQESTHVFICDYIVLNPAITSENSRMIVNGKVYDIVMIDNPMELNQHLEIFLTFTGGQE